MKIGEKLSVMDDYRFPEQFWGGIENKRFAWVFANKSEWVGYTKNGKGQRASSRCGEIT